MDETDSITATALADQPHEHSPEPEPTDDELRAKLAAIRAKAEADGQMIHFQPQESAGLKMHSVAPLVGDWTPPCTSCGEEIGYVAPSGKYVGLTLCAACRGETVGARLAASGIHDDQLNEPLDGLQVTNAEFRRYIEFLRTFAAIQPGERWPVPFAFVCGSNGVGKSAGAQRALRDAIRNGCQGRFVRLGRLIDQIYASYGGNESTDDLLTFYGKQLHLLVIDDVGQETPSDDAMRRFFDVIEDRLGARLPTIITSNYEPEVGGLGAHVTGRTSDPTRMHSILSRIKGGCGPNVFTIIGRDMRAAKQVTA